ncbi:MAG: hypothetical protein U0835_15510 [Isosphaeraceae bacterium]
MMRRRILVGLFWACALASWSRAAEPAATLRAGAAASNITPELGLEIVGGFAPYPGTHVHDELHARCLVLDDGRTKLALVVCDLLGFHRSLGVEARKLVEEATGIPASNVMISATHTHSAASALGERGFRSEQQLDDYQRFVARRIADGVRRALNNARPAEVAFGTVDIPEHLNNRRWFLREGKMPPNPFGKTDKVKMNPGAGSPDLVEPAGPIDPTLSFLAFREPGGRMISVFSAYSLHYVGGVAGADVSADYYGMYCEALARRRGARDDGPPFVALMANGTSGDINNINFRKPRPGKPAYVQMRAVAEDVAQKVDDAIGRASWKPSATLGALFREVEIPWRTVEPWVIEWAKETEARQASAAKKDVVALSYAGRVQRLAKAGGPARVPVQVLRIGDVAIGTSPCETFAETGLEYRKRSPSPHSFMVELAHAYLGYLPTPRHFDLGGYETWPGTNYLEPQASVKIMDNLLEMTGQLMPK